MCNCGAQFEIDCDCRPDYGYIPAHLDARADVDVYAYDQEVYHSCPEPKVELPVRVPTCNCGNDGACDDCLPF